MGAKDITYFSLGLLMLLVLPILYLNSKFKLRINKSILVSILRMTVQLTLVGLYLQYIFRWNLVVINVLYLIMMVSLAAFSVVKSVKLPYKQLLLPVFFSIFIPTFLVIIYFNGVIVKSDFIFDAQYVITIGGMLLGNILSGVIVGLNSFYKGIVNEEQNYLYRLGLGASTTQAMAPYFKEAIFATVNPTIASMATIGLVALPGMMTGQMLGGSVPIVAIKYQIAIMIAIFVVKYFAIVLALWFGSRSFFDGYGRLTIRHRS